MTPLFLELANFTGIKDGLNRDRLLLDFSNLPLGLIAIVGPNGKAKTTIIDNMHPYRIMPSRAKKYSPNSFSFYEHIEPGKAEKVFGWLHNDGKIYKSEIVLNTKSRKSECYLYVQVDDRWVPFVSDDGTIRADGKTEPYDQAIEHLLGAPELFFTSQFLSQNRRALSSYDNSDMKLLMSEMLNIEHMKKLSKHASDVSAILNAELERRKNEIAKFHDLSLQRDRLLEAQKICETEIEILKQKKLSSESIYHSALTQYENYEQQSARGKEKQERINVLNSKLEQLSNNISMRKKQHIETSKNKTQTIEGIKVRIGKLEAQLDLKPKVLEAMKILPQVEINLAKQQQTVGNVLALLEAMNEKKQKIIRIENRLSECKTAGINIASKMEELKEQSSLIELVPCVSMPINSKCPLLVNAHKAKAESATVESKYQEKRCSYRSIYSELEGEKLNFLDPSELRVTVEMANRQLEVKREEHLLLMNLAAKADLISSSENSLKESHIILLNLEKELRDAEASYQQQELHFSEEMEQINVELRNIKSSDLEQTLAELKLKIQQVKHEIANIEGAIEGKIRTQSRNNAELDYVAEKLKKGKNLQKCVTFLSNEIAFWKQLSIGLGNNGTIALCIDDAGPTLSALVNELLTCYGSEYSIEIQTQIDQLNGSIKEGFEIVVHDSKSMKSKKLEYMSGGQKVWINDCLCRGMALYQHANSENICATLFSDETDGALDLEHKRQFMQMKRKVLELSGCNREFFISHTPECIDFADAVIDMAAHEVI